MFLAHFPEGGIPDYTAHTVSSHGYLPVKFASSVSPRYKYQGICFRTHHFVTHLFSNNFCWSATLVCAKTYPLVLVGLD